MKTELTQDEQIEILEDNSIQYEISNSGELIALWRMSTFAGDDCSEWMPATDVVEALNYNPYNHD